VARKKLGHFNEIGSYYQKEKEKRDWELEVPLAIVLT